ncbi:plasmid IncI1-type surface exclusion protein ExcA [Erwinia persicina]|uniref:plasmid IncI1-type surface exclusion protein ExcA n=1 Tax=Erwinia persicina TaxID=55211 RepID=UPI00092FE44A|nr:plasmid IncI1-type surface exclusion protein ExcA [Erwinia persicina]MBD8165403.1 plasmid IncI1-type surface exclusion protein ExcA [Erwinia persicina]
MKTVQRYENKSELFWRITRSLYYFFGLPCLIVLALATLVGIFGNTMVHADGDFYLFSLLIWAAILIPLIYRRFTVTIRRRKLQRMVDMLSHADRFSPQKQHQVMDAGRGKYLGIDTQRGTILYIHMVKKGVIDVMGLTMNDWTDRELEGSALRLYTRMPEVPVLSVFAHPTVAKDLFNTLGAMVHKSYSEPFPDEPWAEYVGRQSRFVEFEHDVVVPQVI